MEVGLNAVQKILISKDNFGDHFLNMAITNDDADASKLALVELLSFIKFECIQNESIFEKFVLSKYAENESILHLICSKYKASSLERVVIPMVKWCSENLSNLQFGKLICQKNYMNEIFLWKVLESDGEDESTPFFRFSKKDPESYMIYYETCRNIIMNLDLCFKKCENFKTLLMERCRDGKNLLEYVQEKCGEMVFYQD